MTGIYIRGGLPPAKFPHKLIFDHAALCRALAAGELAETVMNVVLLDACLEAIRTRPAAERDKGSYRPGKRGVSAATRFGLDLFDVYQKLGGDAGIRSLVFDEFARKCAIIVGVEIPPRENFEMYLYRSTRP
jgi:hypothetical protein